MREGLDEQLVAEVISLGCRSRLAAVGAGEQRVLAIERDRADGTLDDVVVDFDAPLVD